MKLVYLDPDGKTIGHTEVRNGRPVSTGIGRGDAQLHIVEPCTLRHLTPADGDAWLRGLRALCRNAYVRAVLVDSDAAC